ncbi:hypothetical protein ACFPZ0_09715 [Streptomonospora nanhaiensis]|uniref:hypothetical protein n=1 Tax=Streptomonospora nanhaiensis TaxID=1323731 RepID=UPI001C99855E|nr:hypothetical protein [Streptomonospora nanhaiensis]MBX9388414.1 hypothetical protein [Streptomonospora nanhaiensis]
MSSGSSIPEVVEYCLTWNFRRGRVGVPMSQEEAEARNESGEEYTAVVSVPGGGQPALVTVAWKNEYASTQFLDERGRRNVKYVFRKVDGSRMFLNSVLVWTYPNDNPKLTLNQASRIEETSFREDGYVKLVEIDKDKNEKITSEYTDVPVEANWEPVPDFGDYASMVRWERQ